MDTEVPRPQKEPLIFSINLEGTSPDVVEVVDTVKQVAERVLYHWRTFPIVLPPPRVVLEEHEGPASKAKHVHLRDLFVPPSFDELEVVALDPKGKTRRLNDRQLQNIREMGEFEVESPNFLGQVHRWQVSQILQKGTRKTYACLLQDIALIVQLVIITARNRLHSHFFSVSQSIRAFVRGLLLLLDAFIGISSLSAKNLDVRIQEERIKYLVAELIVQSNLEDELDNVCQFVKHQIRKQTTEKYKIENEKPPPVPYIFQTPKGHEIDLRHFNKETIRKALPIIAGILEKEARGWFLPFREKVIAELKTKKLQDSEMERQANIAILDEYIKRVTEAVLAHPDIQALGMKIGELLIEQAQSIVMLQRAVENITARLSLWLSELKRSWEDIHPVLSLIGPWVRERLRAAEEKFLVDHQWDAHDEALMLCRDHHLQQTTYFLHRDLVFMQEREPVLTQELSRVRISTRVFRWRTQIWFPHNWQVHKVFQGDRELIPTVVSRMSLSLAQPRSDPNQLKCGYSSDLEDEISQAFLTSKDYTNWARNAAPVYLVEKQLTRITTTKWPFWRWINYVHRSWSWSWNAMFLFGIVIPWCSPVSLRALFSIQPFMPDLEINQLDGTMYPRKSSSTHTLCSRLLLLWRHISKSRTEFETSPDTGFIGKGFSRHLNRIWNYVVKGALGTLFAVVAFPTMCLVVSGMSLAVAATTLVWMPASAIVFHLCMILFYDFDSPVTSKNRICILLETVLWHILIQGLVQPILALFVALVVCPLAAVMISIMAMVRCCTRMVWDAIIFHLVIKKRGRIPASDSWLVQRVAGPGLTDNYFFKISPEQALAALEAKMETEELNAFREETEQMILQPQRAFSDFVKKCFQPFSATLSKEGIYQKLEKESQELLTTLQDQVDRRKKELQVGLTAATRAKIKLSAPDLQLTIRQASLMLESFYPTSLFKKLTEPEEVFWENKGLPPRDWLGLAAQVLAEVFSPDFLTPLEDSDTHFKLEAHNCNLTKYTYMLKMAEQRMDIDISHAMHTPKGNIRVHTPYIDLATFSPLTSSSATAHKTPKHRLPYPWKHGPPSLSNNKLVIPLPIPHPAQISVIIFNRENEEPIPLESEICQQILKAVEDGTRNSTGIHYGYTNLDNRSITSLGDDPETATVGSEDCLSQGSPTSGSRSQSQRTSGSIVVNLASIEDVTLEPNGQRVTYSHSSYSTTV